MSVPARFWALAQDTKGSERQVLNCLADWMIGNDAVVCWPSVETIAFETGCNRQTVMKATASLKQAGLITKKRRLVNDEWRMHYTLVGYVPSEWVNTEWPTFESTENRKYEKPDLQDYVRTGNSTSESQKNRTSESTAFRTLESTENRTRTGNNKEDKERNKERFMRTSGNSSANAAVASAQAQTLPTSFPQSSNSQNHSEAGIAGKDSLSNASERSVAAHRDRLDASDEQALQNDAGCSQNASTRISGVCPENEPPPMSDEDLENLFANAQLEECPPFPEKGVRPPFEKGAHLSEKGDHPSPAPKRKRVSNVQKPESVSEQVWEDFSALRTKRRAPITETALRGIQREAEKAGISLEAALSTCCERGWQGFKASWYEKDKTEQNVAPRGAEIKCSGQYYGEPGQIGWG